MNTLTLICGIPNAGKTTFSKQFNNVIHTDDIKRNGKSLTSAICDIADTNADVCIEGLFLLSRERRDLVHAFKGFRTVCIWLDTPLDECLRRENRNRATFLIRNSHDVLQPPTCAEGWDEIIIIGDNNGISY